MSVEQIEERILELSAEERRRFAAWYEAHRKDLLADVEEADEELTDEQKTEILRRRDLALAHPELLEPWEGTIDRVRSKLNEFRRQKAGRS